MTMTTTTTTFQPFSVNNFVVIILTIIIILLSSSSSLCNAQNNYEPLTDSTVRSAIELWNTNMMAAEELYGSPIGTWDVRSVTKMGRLFENIDFLSKPNYTPKLLEGWDTSSVFFLDGLFWEQQDLNLDLSSWNVENVEFMNGMFWGTKNLKVNLTGWNTSNVEGMELMFRSSDHFQGIGLENFDTSNVKSFKGLFQSTTNFIKSNTVVQSWNTKSVTDMSFLFTFSKSLALDLTKWNTSSVTDMSSIFANTINFSSNLSDWDTSNVKKMSRAFEKSSGFMGDLSGWDTSTSLVDMDFAFEATTEFTSPLCWTLNSNINLENLKCSTTFFQCECISKDIVQSTTTSCWEYTDACASATVTTTDNGDGETPTSSGSTTTMTTIMAVVVVVALLLQWMLH